MISQKEYKKRREIIGSQLSNHSVAVLFSAEYKTRSNDTEYPYRQNSNFFYLSGFKENNSCLVFVKNKMKVKIVLFVQKKDKRQELWNGKRLGVKNVKKIFLVDEIFTYEKFNVKLKEYMNEKKSLYYDFSLEDKKLQLLKKESKNINSYKNIATIVEKMRLIKSSSEIAVIKKAISITKDAHHNAIRKSKKLQTEYELQAEIEYIFKINGAYNDAYTSIVACGNSANTLHYISNDKALVKGELILIDAGCEYKYYSSDITRTIPVSGKFTSVQRELYQMILDVELEIISMIKPNIKRTKLQKKSEELLCKGMIRLGILKGDYKKLMKKQQHKKYYPHGIGHWMGIDVHDEAPYKDENGKELLLKPGMVMTIEPGIYLPKEDMSIPKKYRGIGIRIEDDILVTKNGYQNLSKSIVKSIEEIENIS